MLDARIQGPTRELNERTTILLAEIIHLGLLDGIQNQLRLLEAFWNHMVESLERIQDKMILPTTT